jgi:CheY-like chemotaxis protein
VGKGTGLGLATVYGIIKQHQGWIEVDSTVGKGSTFRIYFPAMAGATTEKKSGPTTSTLPRGTETILVVEDELIVRLTVCNLLQRFGYTVLPAESGAEAIKVWQKHKDRIQLLLTDIVMPGNMPGYELARQLLAEKPQLKIIYTSGYSEDLADKRVTLMEGVNFLQKPYAPQQLAEALRKTLDPG